MARMLIAFLVVAFAHAAVAATSVGVSELEKIVAHAQYKADARAAQELSELQLIERLSGERLARLNAILPGDRSKLALQALADAASFLDLPASDVPADPAPDPTAQQALLATTADYLRKAMPRSPDFFATQLTTQFVDGPAKESSPSAGKPWDTRLHLAAQSSATVRFLAGKEELTAAHREGGASSPSDRRLAVEGVFGPILAIALGDVLASKPAWSHWEHESSGAIAVFNYTVPEEKSHYSVPLPGGFGPSPSTRAYHGEIVVDPASGAILRLTMQAVTKAGSPIARADIMVEYGPVKIATETWTCPLRSVALASVRNLDLMHDLYQFPQMGHAQFQIKINDVSYTEYHLFRTQMRLLPEDGAVAGPGSQTSPPPSPPRNPQP